MEDNKSIVQERPNETETDYSPFIRATKVEDLRAMETFIEFHPEALTARVFLERGTALHYALANAKEKMSRWLIDRMTAADLEIQNDRGCTALAQCACMGYPAVLDLLKLLVHKNPRLPDITSHHGVPVVLASWRGYNHTTHFLYGVTDKSVVMNPEHGSEGVTLLIICIREKILDIAKDLVARFPKIICQQNYEGENAILVLAKSFSDSSSEGYQKIPEMSKPVHDLANDLLQFVCLEVSTFETYKLKEKVYPAIIYAARHGNIVFLNEMIRANPELLLPGLLFDYSDNKPLFWHAVENRQEKIFNLIYGATAERQDELLLTYNNERNNILHFTATLPSDAVLARISSNPALQMQREILWFKEVWSVANQRYREQQNREGLTPRQLFSRSHKKLIEEGEKLMKETATSSTVVGALILTIMFAAAFTVPGGNNQDTGYPIFTSKILFKLFIICDVLSLSSSATSILVFLTILTNSHGDEDFLFDLPKRLMMGVLTLFFSIATMMVTFCLALTLMLDGDLQFILPITLISSIPVVVFSSSMFRLLSQILVSTFGSSIFDRNTKLPTPCEKESSKDTVNSGTV